MQNFQIPSIVWNLLGSAAVSLAISVFVFIVGVRMGKERMDRKVMREKYQEIFQHFKALADSVENKELKTWRSYPLVGNRYSPLIRAYLNDGTLNLFPSGIRTRMLDLETDTLDASSNAVNEAHTKIAPRLENEIDSALEKETPIQGVKRIRAISALKFALMTDGDFVELKALMEAEPDSYLSIDTSEEQGKVRTRYVRSDNLKSGDLALFIDHLKVVVAEEKEDNYCVFVALEKRLGDMVFVLGKRISDPHPLWETVSSTISDIFRVSH